MLDFLLITGSCQYFANSQSCDLSGNRSVMFKLMVLSMAGCGLTPITYISVMVSTI